MLTPGIIKKMADSAATTLLMEGTVRSVDKSHLAQVIERALIKELDVEKELGKEADEIVRAHMKAARAEGADIDELRRKILNKLARERGLILR